MTQDRWQEGVSGWVYTLRPGQGACQGQLEVLFEQGRMGVPNGMAWNTVRISLCCLCRFLWVLYDGTERVTNHKCITNALLRQITLHTGM